MTHVAVVLAGCGHRDGSEIQETVCTLLALEEAGATWMAFAPDAAQADVIDHRTGEPMDETRNVLTESARLVRGNIEPLSAFDATKFDAIVFPGGFGAAKNLSSFASAGNDAVVRDDVKAAVAAMQEAGKPVGLICVTPAAVGAQLMHNVQLTVGGPSDTADLVSASGNTHVVCPVDDAVVDEANRVASTPAYMHDASVLGVRQGIAKCVAAVLRMAAG